MVLRVEIPKLFFDNILAPKLDTFYTRYSYPHVQLIFSYTAIAVEFSRR